MAVELGNIISFSLTVKKYFN